MADTGHGATIAFGTTTLMGCARQITLPNWVQSMIDSSCLDTDTFRRKVPSDLMEGGQITSELVFDATVAIDPADFKLRQLCTVTLPISVEGNTTNATFTAWGYIEALQFPALLSDALQMASLTFNCDGDDDPANHP